MEEGNGETWRTVTARLGGGDGETRYITPPRWGDTTPARERERERERARGALTQNVNDNDY